MEVTGIEVRIAQARQAAADADRLDKSLDRLGRSGTKAEGGFERLRRSLFSLQGAFGALGVGLTARELINFADAATNVSNRLRLVTGSAQELVQVQDRLFSIAQDTRSAFEGTVGLYGTLARNASELNLQQSQLFDITELINKSIKSSGASAMAASAGLTQLSQALGSGVLRGDEFASVMEQLPSIARSLAAGLNVPIGALRGLAEQGELTAERVVNALLSQSDAIDAEYAKTTGTVADSFVRLQNAAIQSIGSINQNVGGTQILSMAMGSLADNLDTVLKLMATFAAAGLAGVMARLTTNTLAAGKAFNVLAAAMARNPFGLIAVGISAAASALVLFKDEQFTFMGVTAELGDFTSSAWTEIKNSITLNMDEASEFAKSSFGEMASSAGISSTDIITSFSTAAGALPGLWKDSTNLQLAILVGFSQGVTSIAGSIVDSFKEAFSSIRNVATSFFSSLQDFFAGRDLTFGAFRSALNDSFVEPTIEAGQKARDAFTEAFQIDYIGELSGRAAETANSAISSINTSLEGFSERVAASARQAKIARLQTQAFTELMSGKLNPTAEKSNSIFEDLSGRLDKLGKSTKKATRELTEMEKAQAKFNKAIADYPAQQIVRELDAQLEAQDRATEATQRFTEQADPMTEAFENAFRRLDDAASNMWKSFFEGGKSALDNIKSFVTQTLAEIAHALTTKRLVMNVTGAVGIGGSTAAAAGTGGGLGGGFNPASLFGGAPAFGPERISAMGLPTGISDVLASSSFATNPIASGIGGFAGNLGANALLGSDRGMGANIGGTLGAIGGSFLPLPPGVGTAVGAFVGNAIGGLFGSSDFKASLGTAIDRSSPALSGTARDVVRESAFGNVGFGQSKDFASRDAQEFIDSIVKLDNLLATGLLPEQIENVRQSLDGFIGSARKGTGNLDQVKERLTVIFGAIDADVARMTQAFGNLPIEQMIEGFISLNKVSQFLKADPFKDFTESLLSGTRTLYQQALVSRRGLIDLARSFDGSLDAANELANATQNRYQLELALLQQIDTVARGISSSFSDTRETIIQATLSQEQLYDRLSTRAEDLARQMQTAIDPQVIGELAAQINQLTGRAFGLLGEEQKQSSQGGFLDFLSGVENLAGQRLDMSRQSIAVDRNAGLSGTVTSELSKVIGGFGAQQQRLLTEQERAAVAQREAAEASRRAAEAQERAALARETYYSGMGGR